MNYFSLTNFTSNANNPSLRRWSFSRWGCELAQTILAEPGRCALDFETWPTDPAWHAAQAGGRALRGKVKAAKDAARLDAVMNGRAHRRLPCTMQIMHENGMGLFMRLAEHGAELPTIFEGRQADLVAHNAQFETEVLLKAGVAAHVDCTMLAAKALYLTAVPPDSPQPVEFSLAALVEREFGRLRDKTIRDRDWRQPEALDDEAVEYGLADVRDCLDLWQLYAARLEQDGLLVGYREIQMALLATAATNLAGLTLDLDAHASLMRQMQATLAERERELDKISAGGVANHGSGAQVSTWILETVLQTPITPPAEPKLVSLFDYLRGQGGVQPDMGGELDALELPKGIVNLAGRLSLEDATLVAWEAGYIGQEMSTFGEDRPEQDDLLTALDRERFGDRVLTLEDDQRWQEYQAQKDHFDRLHKDDAYRLSNFVIRVQAKTRGAVKGWRTTKTGHLAITKGTKLRKAEQLAEAYPHVSQYLVAHERWQKARKLLDAFGPALQRWRDDDARVRGQFKTWAAATGRQSCVNPNLQQQPNDPAFRALWVAPPGRKLIIADYSQIELRLLSIVADDERLREVYREGRDVHAETASIAFGVPLDQVTKSQRNKAKTVNFGIAYGIGASGLAENSGFAIEEAQAILANVFGAYPGLAEYRERAPREAEQRGYIDIRPNRRVRYDPATSPGTTAINYPIQGGAASVQMRALRMLYTALPANVFLAASVHDEFILEADETDAPIAAKILVDCMARALLDIYPEAEEQGVAKLAAAGIVDSWAQK